MLSHAVDQRLRSARGVIAQRFGDASIAAAAAFDEVLAGDVDAVQRYVLALREARACRADLDSLDLAVEDAKRRSSQVPLPVPPRRGAA